MQAKAGLILENDGFINLKVAQFFLIPGENGGHPRREPEDKHNRPASDCKLNCAASIAPAVPLRLLQSASLNVPPALVHPRMLSGVQIPGEAFPDLALAAASLPTLVELNGPVGDPV